jgi:hypothetical protein
LGRFQTLVRFDDSVCNPTRKLGRVIFLNGATVNSRDGHCRVSVGGSDENALGRQSQSLLNNRFGCVGDFVRQDAVVNDSNRYFVSICFQDETTREQSVANSVGLLARDPAVDPNWECQRIDVPSERTSAELLAKCRSLELTQSEQSQNDA